MNKGVKFIFLPSLVNILIVACQLALWPTTEPAGLTTPTPTVTQSLAGPSPTFTSLAVATLTPTSIAALPTPTAPTGGLTAVPTVTPSPSSLANPVGGPTQIPVMPEAIPDDMSTGWGMALSGFTGEEVSSYTAPTSLEAVRDFYQAELPGLGWEWLYTDIGASLALSRSAAVLIQEFNQGHQRLAVVAMANWGFRSDGPPAVLVVSGQNISGGELLSAFVSLVAGGFDLGPPNPNDVRLQAMHFTMPLLQFDHPSNWLPTRLQMVSFRTDKDGETLNILPQPSHCAQGDETCLVNFAFITRSLFDVPVMIRVYPNQNETTLEAFDAQRWAGLVQAAENPRHPGAAHRPEDMIAPGTLETMELTTINLREGTPGLQRFYRWQQMGLSTSLVSSYTLLEHNDMIIEFHTDFTEEEWATLGPTVQDVILSIELAP